MTLKEEMALFDEMHDDRKENCSFLLIKRNTTISCMRTKEHRGHCAGYDKHDILIMWLET